MGDCSEDMTFRLSTERWEAIWELLFYGDGTVKVEALYRQQLTCSRNGKEGQCDLWTHN